MIYPEFIKNGDYIGVTAPSDGVTDILDLKRLDNAKSKLQKLGLKVVETSNVRKSVKGRSSAPTVQAKELEDLFKNKKVKSIICAGGGEFLLEMLSYVDFDIIRNNPKWIQGYSDPTGLLYIITVCFDIATIYANNFKTFGMENYHKSLLDNIEILKGNLIKQENYDKYEGERQEYITGLEGYNLTKKVSYKSLTEEEITVKGRMIGGCLDILTELFGTRFDKTKDFLEKYKNDGFIWYFDNCELSIEDLIRTMWKFKDNDYFNYTKLIIFGRNISEKSYYDISFKEALKGALSSLNIPIIYDFDLGHVSPRMTIINGAIANVHYKNHKATIEFELK